MLKTLVVGGSGTLGRALVPRLLAQGANVRIMSRTPDRCAALTRAGAEVVHGDLIDGSSVLAACRGCDTVVAAAHSLLGRGRYSAQAVDGEGSLRLLSAARESGVRRFMYVSVHGASVSHPVDFWRIKAETELRVAQSGLEYWVLRPTAFMDFHADKLIGEAVRNDKPVVVFGRGTNPRNFVAADDVAALASSLLTRGAGVGTSLDVGGPDNLSALEVARTYEQFTGKKARLLRIPIGMARALQAVSRPFHAGVSRVLATAIVAETTAQSFDSTALRAQMPDLRLRSLREWLADLPRA